MRKLLALIVGSVLVGGAGMVSTISLAFDHRDAPQALADNAADIADVFTFMRPEPDGVGGFLPSTHLVMVMTFAPGATDAQFDTNVDYIFRVRRATNVTTLSTPNFKIICNFTAEVPQRLLCNANGFLHLSVIGDPDAGDVSSPIRTWAGLASDPAFADVDAFAATVAAKENLFKSPGTNAFEGKLVQAIVVEISVTDIVNLGDAGAAKPVLAVSGETSRR